MQEKAEPSDLDDLFDLGKTHPTETWIDRLSEEARQDWEAIVGEMLRRKTMPSMAKVHRFMSRKHGADITYQTIRHDLNRIRAREGF